MERRVRPLQDEPQEADADASWRRTSNGKRSGVSSMPGLMGDETPKRKRTSRLCFAPRELSPCSIETAPVALHVYEVGNVQSTP